MARRQHRPFDRGLVAEPPVEGEVARHLVPDRGLARIEGERGLDRGRQRLVIDLDQFGRITRLRQALGHHHRHRVADMAHALAHHRRARRDGRDRAVAVGQGAEARDRAEAVAGHIRAGQNGEHPRCCGSRCGVERADAGMRVRRAQHMGKGLARTDQIVDVAAVPGQKTPILDAPDRLADAVLVHGKRPSIPAYRP